MNGFSSRKTIFKDLGVETYGCPKQHITPFSWMLLEAFGDYQSGHLPHAGGVGDQPHYLMQAIRLIEQRIATNDKDRKGKHGSKTKS